MSSFWSELKRRHVTRVTVAYAVVGWLLAQVAEFATETFGAPSWVLRSFVVLLVLGLPVAVLLAWLFDLTPEGVRRTSDDPSAPDPVPERSLGGRIAFVSFLLLAAGAAGWMQFYGPEPKPAAERAGAPVQTPSASSDDAAPRHFDLAFPDDAPLALIGAAELGNGKRAFAISPDGRLVVYVGASDGLYRLYLRDLVADTTTRLPGTEGAFHPFFAPSSAWIGFFIRNELYKVHVSGSDPVFVSEATNTVGAGWTARDEIVMVIEEGDKLVKVSASGGALEVVYDGDTQNGYLDVIRGTNTVINRGRLFDLSTREKVDLPIGSADVRYAGGYLLFVELGTLRAARYDVDTNTLLGQPVPVLTGVRTEIWGQGQWSVSDDGTMLYKPGGDARANPMHWVSSSGRVALDLPTRFRGSMEISPDGDRIAVIEFNGQSYDVWVYDWTGGRASKLTTDGRIRPALFWAPDGLSVHYQKMNDEGGRATYRRFIDSQQPPERVLPADMDYRAESISRDGRLLGVTGPEGIAVYDLGSGEVTAVPSRGGDWGSSIAPNGRAIVYTSSVTGDYHNFLQPVPPTGQRFQVSRDGGAEEPRWSPDGRSIYYRSGSRIMKVSVSFEPEIRLGEPEVFFSGVFENVGGRSYDIHPDGERALVIYSEDLAASIRVVTNWFREVESMVGEAAAGSP